MTSDWLGMSHDGPQTINVALVPKMPAYVEVSIDPAAHGSAGLGPITRMVALTTATGQELQFTLKATVTE